MSSKTYLFNRQLFANAFRRTRGFWITYAVVYIILAVIYTYSEFDRMRRSMLNLGASAGTYPQVIDPTPFLYLSSIFVLIMALIMGIALFSFLNRQQPTDLFLSTPARRQEMFFSFYLAGAVSVTVPPVITVIIVKIISLFFADAVLVPGSTVALVLIITVIMSLGVFAAVSLACTIGSNEPMQILFSLFFLYAPGIYCYIVQAVVKIALYGFDAQFYGLYKFFTSWNLLTVTNPVMAELARNPSYQQLGYIVAPAICSIILTAIYFIAGYLCFTRRRAEKCHEPVAFNGFRRAFKYLILIPFGLVAISVAFALEKGSHSAFPLIMIVVAGFFTFAVIDMALAKSISVLKKRVVPGFIVSVVVFGVCYLLLSNDVAGFNSRIPDPENVTSVQIKVDSWGNQLNPKNYRSTGGNIFSPVFETRFTDKNLISKTLALHKEIVSKYKKKPDVANSVDYAGSYSYYAYQDVRIIYHLKGLGTIKRSYSINTAAYEKLVDSIAKDPVYLKNNFKVFSETPEEITFDGIETAASGELLEAVRHDLLNMDFNPYVNNSQLKARFSDGSYDIIPFSSAMKQTYPIILNEAKKNIIGVLSQDMTALQLKKDNFYGSIELYDVNGFATISSSLSQEKQIECMKRLQQLLKTDKLTGNPAETALLRITINSRDPDIGYQNNINTIIPISQKALSTLTDEFGLLMQKKGIAEEYSGPADVVIQ